MHKNQFAPQAQDLLEKLAEILLYNFHREHIFLKLKIKKLLQKNKSKNLSGWSLVLVQPRKTCPYITERLLMGRKESNQTNKL